MGWWKMGRIAPALGLLGLLALAPACAGIETSEQKPAAAAVASGAGAVPGVAQDAANPPAALRTAEIFDPNKYKGMLTIRYLYLTSDVATGDCILIQTPDGKTMMIDSGLATVGDQVLGYMKKLGIDTIDVALNTHPHTDHIGGFAAIATLKRINQFYMENLPYPDSKTYNDTMKALQRKNVPIKYLESGDTFQVGDEVKVEVFNPPAGKLPGAITSYDTAVINSYSIVLKMTYKNQTFLFSGDIYKDREKELVDQFGSGLKADFAHVPHHGSTTSSSELFVGDVLPKVAVISNNIFSNFNVAKEYDLKKTKVYSTGFHGNVLVVSDGNELSVITEKDYHYPPLLMHQ